MWLKSICSLSFSIFAFLLYSQDDKPLFRKLSEKNGLSNSRTTCFLKDKKGYLWVGTALGLNRYDGLRFEKFMHNSYNPFSLSWNVITALEEDKEGNIWIGTEAGGLNMYNPITKKFTHFREDKFSKNTITDDHIMSLKVDTKNQLWIGYKFSGWSIMNLSSKQFIHEKSGISFTNNWGENAANTVTDFVHDQFGNTWVISNYGIIHRNNSTGKLIAYIDNKGKYYKQNENLFIKGVLLSDTALALTTWGCGIKVFDFNKKLFTTYLFDKQFSEGAFTNIVLGIAPKNTYEYWIGSADRGLGIFNATQKTFQFYKHDPEDSYSPPRQECRVVYRDNDGLLWAGFDHGFCFWAPSLQNFKVTSFTNFTGPNNNTAAVFATCFIEKENVLFYSREFGKGLYEKREKTGKIICHQLPQNYVNTNSQIRIGAIFPMHNNCILLQTSSGWYSFDIQKKQFNKVILNYKGKQIAPAGYSSKPDNKGNAWFTDTQQNLYKINLYSLSISSPFNGIIQKYPLNDFSYILSHLNDNKLWVHDKIFALTILNTATNTIDTAYLEKGLARIYDAKTIVADKQRHFWITTFSSGLYEMWQTTSGKFTYKHYTESQGLPDMFLSSMVIDSSQKLWIASKGGIISFDTKQKLFKFFGTSDGYNIEWSDINELNLHPSGKLYISHRKGYSELDVYHIKKNEIPPPIHIYSFKVNSKEWIDSVQSNNFKSVSLKYHQNYIGFSFIGLNFINAGQNQYTYKLDGVDKEWVKSGSRREVTYSDLKPGEYTFWVNAANNDGIWNSQPISFQFNIQPPFWKRVWFILLCVAVFFAIMYKLYTYRTQSIRKEERLKADFDKKVAEVELKALKAQMNPHFIFNCLNSINRYIIKSDQATASNYLTRFAKLIRLILDHSGTEVASLHNELELLKLYIEMEQLRFNEHFKAEITIDETINLNTIEIPTMLIQPYIENAIWHGLLHKETKGKLQLDFKLFENNIIQITIEDDGVGRKKAAELKSKEVLREKSFGMTISGDRIKIINQLYNQAASCTVYDLCDIYNRPCGTRVVLKLPYKIINP